MKSARAGPGAQGLRPTFRDIMDTATKDAAIIEAVFPDAASAKEAYLTRVLEQRVGGLPEVLLLDAHDGALPIAPDGATSGKFGRPSTAAVQVSDADKVLAGGAGSAYIRTLASAHEMTLELAKQLAELGPQVVDAVGLAASLFHERRGGYVDDEISSLRLSADAQAVREDSESVGPAGTSSRAPSRPSGIAMPGARCESVLRSGPPRAPGNAPARTLPRTDVRHRHADRRRCGRARPGAVRSDGQGRQERQLYVRLRPAHAALCPDAGACVQCERRRALR